MKLVSPYFLRRDKKTLFGRSSPSRKPRPSVTTKPSPPKPANVCTTRKNDLVVWLKLSEPQHRLYEDFLGSEEVRNALNQTQSHLAALTRLKQICTHPALLTHDTLQKSIAFHTANSAKVGFLVGLIPDLKAAGHRLLIFSQYTTMLDIIQSCVIEMGCKFMRIDGSISSTAGKVLCSLF
jgi:SNF2 family DNA or RNA helicase